MRELIVPATKEAIEEVIHTLEQEMERRECSMKNQMQLNIALEELLVNIVHYAYKPEENGQIKITYELQTDENGIYLYLICSDKGKEYNPLRKKDPDITLSVEKRPIGGLGIFMAKKLLDSIQYERKDDENRIFIKKQFLFRE